MLHACGDLSHHLCCLKGKRAWARATGYAGLHHPTSAHYISGTTLILPIYNQPQRASSGNPLNMLRMMAAGFSYWQSEKENLVGLPFYERSKNVNRNVTAIQSHLHSC